MLRIGSVIVCVALLNSGLALAQSGPLDRPGPPGEVHLPTMDGTDGFVLTGNAGSDNLGAFLSAIGDINGDGFGDFAASQNNVGSTQAKIAVVFGKAGGIPASFKADTLDGSNGFIVSAAVPVPPAIRDEFTAVSGPGDLNGDGIDDLVVGLGNNKVGSKGQAGQVFVIYGKNTAFAAELLLADIDGTNGFRIDGAEQFLLIGERLGGHRRGDFNNDGKADLLIGSRTSGVYVVYGKASNFAHPFDLGTLDGSNGFQITKAANNDGSGNALAAAGDVNGDGIDDIIMGAKQTTIGNTNKAGAAYVIFGSTSAFPAAFDPSTLDGSNGFSITGIAPDFSATGTSVDGAGDFNGDGIADIIVGTPAGAQAGRADVIFGSNSGFSASLSLGDITAANGFTLTGERAGTAFSAGDQLGSSVSGAGDINGDNIADILVGAQAKGQSANNQNGEAYVVFGSSSALPASMVPTDLNGNNGLFLTGGNTGDTIGDSVSAADINNDGFSDLIVGSRGNDKVAGGFIIGEVGAAYVVYGKMSAAAPVTIVAAMLPGARSGYVGGPDVSVFATVINGGNAPINNCSIARQNESVFVADVGFQETNPATNAITGTLNAPFNLTAGEAKTFILILTPRQQATSGREIFPIIFCDNAFVQRVPGVNGVFLTIGNAAGPDILSIAATPDANGIITLPDANGSSFMTVSTTNIGLGDGSTSNADEVSVTASIRTVSPALPLTITVCETDALGACKNTPTDEVGLVVGNGASFLAVFVSGNGTAIPLDAANTRITLDLKTADNKTLSSTSVAVRTAP
jgi:FG-GAP repeat